MSRSPATQGKKIAYPQLSPEQVTQWKGTIGITGFNPVQVAKLNKYIIEYGNSIGLTDDQHFPEIIAVGIKNKDPRYLVDQIHFCDDFGCDIIAVIGVSGTPLEVRCQSEIMTSKGKDDLELQDLARQVLDQSIAISSSRKSDGSSYCRRPDLLSYDGSSLEINPQLLENLELDKFLRTKRINDRKDHGGYPILDRPENKFVFVAGGAGPLASQDFFSELTSTLTPAIHWSQTSAPGKQRFEIKIGPSYIPHYRMMMDFAEEIDATCITIPCNTTHGRLREFCSPRALEMVIDIRKSVIDDNPNAPGLILLGTNRTIGMGLGEGQVGAYEQCRQDFYPRERPFFTPDEIQQTRIMSAIYDVKAGRVDEAKEKILAVVSEMRASYGDFPVLLACTELPLAGFDEGELIELRFYDPSKSMAEGARKQVVLEQVKSSKAIVIPSGFSRKSQVISLAAMDFNLDSNSRSGSSSDNESVVMVTKRKGSDLEDESYGIVLGYLVGVFKETKPAVRGMPEMVTYRIAIPGDDHNPGTIAAKSDLLRKIESDIVEKDDGEKMPRHPEDRIRRDKYIAFHNPVEELEEKIKKWAQDNNINITEGKVPSSKGYSK